MARLPDIQEQPSPVPSPSMGYAGTHPSDGRGLASLAQTGKSMSSDYGEVVNLVAATNARHDEQIALDAANRLHEARIQQEYDQVNGFRNAREGAAVGQQFIQRFGENFGRSVSTIRDSLQNDHQRKLFDRQAEIHGLQFKSALMAHQAQETDKFYDGKDNASIELQLREIALRGTPLAIESGLISINGTVDNFARRKGYSEQETSMLKTKYREAAHTAQIMSILHGGPGREPDPMGAEARFNQVQEVFSPEARVRIGADIQKAVTGVAEKETANNALFGRRNLGVKELTPALEGQPLAQAIVPAVLYAENSADNAVSPKGARSTMQVMPATAKSPGLGVTPAKENADGTIPLSEYKRVGIDYAGALASRYQDPVLALAAYNAGYGEVDKWIAKYGDPRTGQVSHDEFVAKIPFPETKAYVIRGMSKIDKGQFTTQEPTSKDLKVDLYTRAKNGYDAWLENHPSDTAGAIRVQNLVLNRGNLIIQEQAAREQAAGESLINAVVGTKPDGSDAAKTMDQLMADPEQRKNWKETTAPVRDQIQKRFAQGKNDLTKEGADVYYKMLGLAVEDPLAFADRSRTNLMELFGTMPDPLWHELSKLQSSISKNDAEAMMTGKYQKQAYESAKQMFEPVLFSIKDKVKREAVDGVLRGKLAEAVTSEFKQTGKWPDDARSKQLAAGLLAKGKIETTGWFDRSAYAYEADANPGFYVELPPKGSKEYVQAQIAWLKANPDVKGRMPTEAELQRAWTFSKTEGIVK